MTQQKVGHLQVTSPGAKQVGPASLTSKRRETEAELTMGGTWAWVAVAAALGREACFPRSLVPCLCAALFQTAKPCLARSCQG